MKRQPPRELNQEWFLRQRFAAALGKVLVSIVLGLAYAALWYFVIWRPS